MYKIVRIGDKDVPMLSMASVDLYYKNVFGEDPLVVQQNMGSGEAIGFYQRMAFIMAKYAEVKERKEMLKLSFDSFLEWMEQYDRDELILALEPIMLVYNGQMAVSAESKKKDDGPSAS